MSTSTPTVRAKERTRRALVGICAALAAAISWFSAPAMTAYPVADSVWAGVAAALMVICAANSRRSAWLIASCLHLAVSGSLLAALPSAAAVGLALISIAVDRRMAAVGALLGLFLAVSTGRMPQGLIHGLPTLMVITAWTVLGASAYGLARPASRRRARIAFGVFLGMVVVASLAFLWVAGEAMRGVDSAAAELRAAVVAADNDDRSLSYRLESVHGYLAEVEAAMTGPTSRVADLVPIVGKQSRVLREVALLGADLGTAGAAVAEVSDYRRLAVEDQQVALGPLEETIEPVAGLVAELQRAGKSMEELDTDWLIPPVARRVENFHDEIKSAIPSTGLALEVLRVAPDLLGAQGRRTYLIGITQPSEARGLGGFLGSWGELRVEDGRIDLVETGRSDDLNLAPGYRDRVLNGPEDYISQYGRFQIQRYLMDVTMSPHMPSVGEVFADQYSQITGTTVDGVIILDPFALAGLLEITGPIRVQGRDEQLTSENLAEYLLFGQYREIEERDERGDALDAATRRVFDRLLGRQVFEPARFGRILGPLVSSRRIMAWSPNPEEQEVLELLGMTGAFGAPEGGEIVSVVSQNSGNDKLDYFLRREVSYEAIWDPEAGTLDADMTVVVSNDAPASGLPPYVVGTPDPGDAPGTNRQILTINTVGVADSIVVDGVDIVPHVGVEQGVRAYSVDLIVPPGSSVTVEMKISVTSISGARLPVQWLPQPLANADTLDINIGGATGWEVTRTSARLDEGGPGTLEFLARRAE